MIYFIIEDVYPFMVLPRVGVGKPQKETEEKNQSHRKCERFFVTRKARTKTLKPILKETLLLFSYRSLLFVENVRDLSPE